MERVGKREGRERTSRGQCPIDEKRETRLPFPTLPLAAHSLVPTLCLSLAALAPLPLPLFGLKLVPLLFASFSSFSRFIRFSLLSSLSSTATTTMRLSLSLVFLFPLLSTSLALAEPRPARKSINLVDSPLSRRAVECGTSSVAASATYSGSNSTGGEVRLRISNGGGAFFFFSFSGQPRADWADGISSSAAGQSGLVGALAEAFVDYAVSTSLVSAPFSVRLFLSSLSSPLSSLPYSLHFPPLLPLSSHYVNRSTGSPATPPTPSSISHQETPTSPSPTTLKPSTAL
jgi:hypothetical protein